MASVDQGRRRRLRTEDATFHMQHPAIPGTVPFVTRVSCPPLCWKWHQIAVQTTSIFPCGLLCQLTSDAAVCEIGGPPPRLVHRGATLRLWRKNRLAILEDFLRGSADCRQVLHQAPERSVPAARDQRQTCLDDEDHDNCGAISSFQMQWPPGFFARDAAADATDNRVLEGVLLKIDAERKNFSWDRDAAKYARTGRGNGNFTCAWGEEGWAQSTNTLLAYPPCPL